jgi:hypothetical protein
MSRDPNVALYGALVVRLVDRMMQFRSDRVKAMLAGKISTEDDVPDGLSRYDEATALVAIVQAAKYVELPRDYSTRNGDDMGSYFRLYGLKEGRVLTASDIVDLEAVLAELNDEIGHQADKAHEWRMDALREIGGDELVKAIEAKEQAIVSASVEKALARFRENIPDTSSSREAAS